MDKLLVIGGSRGIGREVCTGVIAGGYDVRAMSRSGAKLEGVNGSCEAFKGDALNVSDGARALEGVDAVVQALEVPPLLNLITKPVTLFSEATQVLLPEMEKAGVKRLVAVTGFGAGDSNASINILQRVPFKALLGRAYDDKSAQEKLIEQSNLDWLIVRLGVLTNRPASGKYRVLREPNEWRNGIVSRADVADFIIKQLKADQLERRKPVVIRYHL